MFPALDPVSSEIKRVAVLGRDRAALIRLVSILIAKYLFTPGNELLPLDILHKEFVFPDGEKLILQVPHTAPPFELDHTSSLNTNYLPESSGIIYCDILKDNASTIKDYINLLAPINRKVLLVLSGFAHGFCPDPTLEGINLIRLAREYNILSIVQIGDLYRPDGNIINLGTLKKVMQSFFCHGAQFMWSKNSAAVVSVKKAIFVYEWDSTLSEYSLQEPPPKSALMQIKSKLVTINGHYADCAKRSTSKLTAQLKPCNHIHKCFSCLLILWQNNIGCPTCNEPILAVNQNPPLDKRLPKISSTTV